MCAYLCVISIRLTDVSAYIHPNPILTYFPRYITLKMAFVARGVNYACIHVYIYDCFIVFQKICRIRIVSIYFYMIRLIRFLLCFYIICGLCSNCIPIVLCLTKLCLVRNYINIATNIDYIGPQKNMKFFKIYERHILKRYCYFLLWLWCKCCVFVNS